MLQAFEGYWLSPAGIAPPMINSVEQEASEGTVVVRLKPLRPEDAEWNQWKGTGTRLFNNRSAYLFEVQLQSEGSLRWLPERTYLELNVEGNPIEAAASPEELLRPLLAAALDQERFVLDGDLVDRTRAAGPFRAVYMPLSEQQGMVEGVIAFPLDDSETHVVGLKVTIGVGGDDGPKQLSIVYD